MNEQTIEYLIEKLNSINLNEPMNVICDQLNFPNIKLHEINNKTVASIFNKTQSSISFNFYHKLNLPFQIYVNITRYKNNDTKIHLTISDCGYVHWVFENINKSLKTTKYSVGDLLIYDLDVFNNDISKLKESLSPLNSLCVITYPATTFEFDNNFKVLSYNPLELLSLSTMKFVSLSNDILTYDNKEHVKGYIRSTIKINKIKHQFQFR